MTTTPPYAGGNSVPPNVTTTIEVPTHQAGGGGHLPFTGSEVTGLLVVAAIAIAVGLRLGRRRHQMRGS